MGVPLNVGAGAALDFVSTKRRPIGVPSVDGGTTPPRGIAFVTKALGMARRVIAGSLRW